MQKEQIPLETPVLFLIFNRPDLTEKVFGQIRKVRPRQLFIAADGPRESHPDDLEKCKQTRELVLGMIDWDCEVKTLIRDTNLGCGLAVSQAITWFFEHVEMGIILEDDCLPDLSFFWFCEELLTYFKHDNNVMHIGGSSYILNNRIATSYFFSAYPHIWGWATWSNKWKYFKYDIKADVERISKICDKYLNRSAELRYWLNQFNSEINENFFNSWALRWHFNVWVNKGVSVLPSNNLILNIGEGENSTHTKSLASNYKRLQIRSMEFPLIHPTCIVISKKLDQFNFDKFFIERPTFSNKLRNIGYRYINKSIYNIGKKVLGRI